MNFQARFFHRQASVLGERTQKNVREMRVFVSNVNLLGAEIVKNLVMMGVKQIALFDETIVSEIDATNCFYFSKDSIGKNSRAKECKKRLEYLAIFTEIIIAPSNNPEWISLNAEVAVLVDCWDYPSVVSLDLKMRSLGKGMIWVGNLSLYGFIFVDFGQNHIVNDVNGEKPIKAYIKRISKSNEAVLELADEWNLLSVGQQICIQNARGMTEINGNSYYIIKKREYSITINADTTLFSDYRSGGIITVKKRQAKLNFSSFSLHFQNFKHQKYGQEETSLIFQSQKYLNPKQYAVLKGFFTYYSKYHRLPLVGNQQSTDEIVQILESQGLLDFINQTDRHQFHQELTKLGLFGEIQISCFTSIWGGIAAQQVIKLTGMYTPICQWLHFDQLDLIQSSQNQLAQIQNNKNKMIFGSQLAQKLQRVKLMMVGAGALSSQYIKIFCDMNLGNQGEITIVDNDCLADYNLNRMCLVEKSQIGKNKAQLLSHKWSQLNQHIKTITIKQRIKKTDHKNKANIPSKLWQKQDIILCAVDSFSSRSIIDSYCTKYSKIMLNCGSQCLKFSTDVIIPHLTGNYIDLMDKEGQCIPLELKNQFPYKIYHSVKRSVDKLQKILQVTEYLKLIKQDKNYFLNQYLTERKRYQNWNNQQIERMLRLNRIHKQKSFEKCVEEALIQFYLSFTVNPQNLLKYWPRDLIIEHTQYQFWSGTRNLPHVIQFNPQDEIHRQFVYSLSIIYSQILEIKPLSEQDTIEIAKTIFQNENFTLICLQRASKGKDEGEISQKRNQQLLRQYWQTQFGQIKVHTFQLRNPSISHLSFLYASSIIQARVYRLQEASRMEIEGMACNVVPTIITGIAIAAGFTTLELIKLLKEDKKAYRNTYANFAISLMVQAQPCGPKLIFDSQYDPISVGPVKAIPECQSNWDCSYLVGPMTVSQLRHHYEDRLKITIDMIMVANSSTLLHGFNMQNNRIVSDMEISAAYQYLSKTSENQIEFPIELVIVGTSEDEGSDSIIPPIKYYRQS